MNNSQRFDRIRALGATALAAVALVVVLAAAPAIAQPTATQPAAPPIAQPLPEGTFTAAQIQLMLDTPVEPATLHNALLLDVLRKLEGGKARWLDLPGSTLSFLPYGEETPVSLRVPADGKKTPLRAVLNALIEPLCLTYRIIEDDRGRGVLRIVPRAELHRVGRRAAIDEMDVLYQLRTLRIESWKTSLLAQVQAAAGKPIGLQFDLTGLDAAAAYKKFNDSVSKMAPSTVAGLLDQFCMEGGSTWRVEGNSIRIIDKVKQVVHQLNRHVSVRWADMPLEQALVQIANSAGVAAQFQPGMFTGVEPSSQRITWSSPDESIIQIIETLSGRTGISYEVHDDSVLFFGPRRNSQDPVIGQVTMGTRSGKFTYQLFLRKSMLS
ncbi:MAG: hypothetical protein PHU85_10580, partial [Phycisphaerae bacterium]|nr:hypothetical protein [Phycisphaerae bacterium]